MAVTTAGWRLRITPRGPQRPTGRRDFNAGPETRALWSGTAESWVDLHPPAAAWSEAQDIHDGHQVGAAWVGHHHASLWSGTAQSWVDLHPAGTVNSYALGVYAGRQVGYVTISGTVHAAMWSGTAGSWEALPPPQGSWNGTIARDIWCDATTVYVAGVAISQATLQYEAILWTRPIPSPGAGALLGFGALLAARRRRRF